MNIEEYISSGILEAYVLGDLSQKEEQEVLEMAEKHPEIKKEIELIEMGLEDIAFHSAVEPPSHVKEQLFTIEDNNTASHSPKGKVVEMPKQTAPVWKFTAAAAVILAVVSSVLAYNYWNKWSNTQQELNELIAQNERVAEDYNRVNEQLDKIEDDLSIMNNTAFKRVAMNGTENSPNSLAYIYWNESSEEVYLSVQQLKQLTQQKQYQLWAIIDGTPVDAGVFDLNDNTALIKMKNITTGASAFAVTIEPTGGSESPTLETMQVMGPIEKS